MMLTRYSSTPSAEILVNASGSSRRTVPRNAVSPPHLLDQDRVAGFDAHGILREDVHHDLEPGGIADLDERRAGLYDPGAFLRYAKDPPRRRCARTSTSPIRYTFEIARASNTAIAGVSVAAGRDDSCCTGASPLRR
jgi:hypothetical protein